MNKNGKKSKSGKKNKKDKAIKGKTGVMLCAAVLLCAAILFAILQASEKEDGVVCYVNGEPVYEKEIELAGDYVWYAQEQRFAEMTGQEIGEVDLSVEAEGRTGYEYLADAVAGRIIHTKVLEIEAQKNGLCKEIDYPEIEKARQEENERRAAAKAENGVVYGVVSFDEEEYFSYFIENLDLQNERYMIQEGIFQTDEEEVKEAYEKDPSAFDNQPYDTVSVYVKNAVLSQKYRAYMDELEENAGLEGKERIAEYLEEIGY